MSASGRRSTVSQSLMSFIFVVVCCACLLLAVVASVQSLRELHDPVVPPAQPPGNVSPQTVKDEFDLLKDRTDNLQKLITTLIALSSLYAIVLTVTGYLNVQKILQEAQDSLDDAVKTKETLAKEYGSLTHISENLEKVTKELRERLPDVRELSSSFEELNPSDHQRLYFQEKAIAFAQLVSAGDDADVSARLSGAFVSLARFYRGLFLYEQKKLVRSWKDARFEDAGSWILWDEETKLRNGLLRERGLFYARQAVWHSPESFIALNELGNCLLEYGDTKADEALNYFRMSLTRNQNQQKARFAISAILHVRGHYKDAENLLTEALGLLFWEQTRETSRIGDLRYNRACAHCKMAETCRQDQFFIESKLSMALSDLKLARIGYSQASMETFLRDIEEGGDLHLLATHPAFADEVSKLR